MHKLERYGVVALVFLLVTIIAVSLWSGGSDGDFWSRFWTGPEKAPIALRDAPSRRPRSQNPAARSDSAWPSPVLAQGTGRTSSAEQGTPGRRAPGRRAGRESAGAAGLRGRGQAAGRAEKVRARDSRQPTQASSAQASIAPPRTSEPAPRQRPARLASTSATVETSDSYTVRPGDTLSGIAQKVLGSTKRWREIVSLNPGIDPDRLAVGAKLVLRGSAAPVATPRAAAANPGRASGGSAPSTGRTYVVAAGDTLSGISRRLLGSASRWGEIVKVNPGLNPDRLYVGKRLTLPSDAVSVPRAEPTTRLASAAQPRSGGARVH